MKRVTYAMSAALAGLLFLSGPGYAADPEPEPEQIEAEEDDYSAEAQSAGERRTPHNIHLATIPAPLVAAGAPALFALAVGYIAVRRRKRG